MGINSFLSLLSNWKIWNFYLHHASHHGPEDGAHPEYGVLGLVGPDLDHGEPDDLKNDMRSSADITLHIALCGIVIEALVWE